MVEGPNQVCFKYVSDIEQCTIWHSFHVSSIVRNVYRLHFTSGFSNIMRTDT